MDPHVHAVVNEGEAQERVELTRKEGQSENRDYSRGLSFPIVARRPRSMGLWVYVRAQQSRVYGVGLKIGCGVPEPGSKELSWPTFASSKQERLLQYESSPRMFDFRPCKAIEAYAHVHLPP